MQQLRTAVLIVTVAACAGGETPAPEGSAQTAGAPARPFPDDPGEPRLRNLRQITFGGENAEAYFSADGRQLIFQANEPPDVPCDQIFIMDIDGGNRQRVSTGQGRTTCAYFYPAGDRILYSSTHLADTACPPSPDYSRGYVWPLYDYDVFVAAPDGSNARRITETPGYDAEATISRDGSTIVFTSIRDGDLDIYVMDADGANVRRLTNEPGYDGGPFFSPDGTRIVYRAHHPTDPGELSDYQRLLQEDMLRPGELDIWIMDADGSNKRKVLDAPGADFAPFFHPDGQRIIFSSNQAEPTGRNFDLYMVALDGTVLERITQHADFDGFPMFSPDGTKLVFASNRGARQPGETNIFLADWVEDLPAAAGR
jgi:Tol biopolymer transport system component